MSGRTAADGKSCLNETGFLIVSGRKKIAFFPANPLSRPPPFSPITRRLRNIVALDIDFESKLIYYADSGRRAAIKAVYLNGTGMRVVVGGKYTLETLRFVHLYLIKRDSVLANISCFHNLARSLLYYRKIER